MSKDMKYFSIMFFIMTLLQVCNLFATIAGMGDVPVEQPTPTRIVINNTPLFETAQARFTETMKVYETVVAKVTPFPSRTPTPDNIFPPGTYIVGTDIQPGLYKGQAGTGLLSSCYWERLSDLSGNIIINDNAMGQFYIEVLSTDFALKTSCELQKIK